MTDPTPLSPAAQAVLGAANGKSSYGPDDCLNESRWIAAAALRAAAEQCVSNGFGNKWMITAHVLSIAKELER